MDQQEAPKVYAAINAVMNDMASEGISKGRRNKDQGYNFRGIDDVYSSLSRALVTHGLIMLPRAKSHKHDIRQTAKGSNQYVAIMEIEFDLVAVADGSKHTICTWGEAYDMADKSTNKAMSAAYKYAALQAFCIPTEGDNDADLHTPEETVPAPILSMAERLLNQLAEGVASKKTLADLEAYYKEQEKVIADTLDGDDVKRANGIFGRRKKELTPAPVQEVA